VARVGQQSSVYPKEKKTTQSGARVLVVGVNPGGTLGTFDGGDGDWNVPVQHSRRASEYSVGTREWRVMGPGSEGGQGR